jgi:hypothetical protein
MRYSTARKTSQNILIPLTSAEHDVGNGWSKAVDSQHVMDPNILCLSRDWNEYNIGDEDDHQIDIAEGMEMTMIIEHYKTHPEHAEIASQVFTDDIGRIRPSQRHALHGNRGSKIPSN